MTRTPALARLAVVVLTALLLIGYWMYQNDFRGDTQAGRIQLDIDQIRGASEDDVTELRLHPGLGGYQKVLLPRLLVGTQVTVDVSVAEFGFYRLGGGWIFRGERFLGRYPVAASALTVKSSNPSSLDVHSAHRGRDSARISAVIFLQNVRPERREERALDSATR